MSTQTRENILVDISQITPLFEQFFYKIFQIPPEIPIYQATKVQHYVDMFLNKTIGLALDNPAIFIANINKHDLLNNVISEDLQAITENAEELKMYLLYALNQIVISINYSYSCAYLISLITPGYMIISAHKLNEEADTLVYS
jgi:hypothetical protein